MPSRSSSYTTADDQGFDAASRSSRGVASQGFGADNVVRPGEHPSSAPKPGTERHSFFHSSIREHRTKAFKILALLILVIGAGIMAILSIYWGALLHMNENISTLTVFVVDFDGIGQSGVTPTVGPALVQAARQMIGQPMTLGWTVMEPSTFHDDPQEVFDAVYNNKAWGAVIVNSNATSLLNQAVSTRNASYDPNGALQIVYAVGRDMTTVEDFVVPELQLFSASFPPMFGQQHLLSYLSSKPSDVAATMQAVPQAFISPVGFSTYNIVPQTNPVLQAPLMVGLIYLLIVSFYAFVFFSPAHILLAPKLTWMSFVLWRILVSSLSYFLLSLCYSLVSLAFQVDFTVKYGRGGFPLFWLLNWMGFAALGLATENVGNCFGQTVLPFWLLFWVISNSSTAFFAIQLEATIFQYGYAFPLHNVVEASRTILNNASGNTGQNFGILAGWIGVGLLLFPFSIWIYQRGVIKHSRGEWLNIEQKREEGRIDEKTASTSSPQWQPNGSASRSETPAGAFAV